MQRKEPVHALERDIGFDDEDRGGKALGDNFFMNGEGVDIVLSPYEEKDDKRTKDILQVAKLGEGGPENNREDTASEDPDPTERGGSYGMGPSLPGLIAEVFCQGHPNYRGDCEVGQQEGCEKTEGD
jgi:hypothetical protein